MDIKQNSNYRVYYYMADYCIFMFEREREQGRCREREGDTEYAGSRL